MNMYNMEWDSIITLIKLWAISESTCYRFLTQINQGSSLYAHSYGLFMHNRVADCIQKPQHHTRYVIWNAKQEKIHQTNIVQNRSRNVKSPKHTHVCSSHMFLSGCFQWENFAIPNQHHTHFYKQSKICFFRQPPHQILTVSFVGDTNCKNLKINNQN